MGIAEEMESPQCMTCIWKNPDEVLCAAFPYGIPDEILRNETLHSEVLAEQFGDYIYTAL
jgi:hypothetical protein